MLLNRVSTWTGLLWHLIRSTFLLLIFIVKISELGSELNDMRLARTIHQNDKVSAVIVYFVREHDVDSLIKSISLLDNNFNSQFRYPIYVYFDDRETQINDKEAAIQQSSQSALLHLIPLRMDDKIDISQSEDVFYSHIIQDHQSLQGFDMIMSLRPDTKILSKAKIDLFKYTNSMGSIYTYNSLNRYDKSASKFILTIAFTFAKLHHISIRYLVSFAKTSMPRNNEFHRNIDSSDVLVKDRSLWAYSSSIQIMNRTIRQHPDYKNFMKYLIKKEQISGAFPHEISNTLALALTRTSIADYDEQHNLFMQLDDFWIYDSRSGLRIPSSLRANIQQSFKLFLIICAFNVLYYGRYMDDYGLVKHPFIVTRALKFERRYHLLKISMGALSAFLFIQRYIYILASILQ